MTDKLLVELALIPDDLADLIELTDLLPKLRRIGLERIAAALGTSLSPVMDAVRAQPGLAHVQAPTTTCCSGRFGRARAGSRARHGGATCAASQGTAAAWVTRCAS